MDAQDNEFNSMDVLIRGNRIERIGRDLQAEAEKARVIDGRDKLLMPGLVNGHFHSPGNLNRGNFDGLPLELFMLYEVPPLNCPPLPPRLHYVRTLLGATEMLKAGVTSVHDDAFYVPEVSMELVDAVMQGYRDSGMRATVSINMPNVFELDKYPFLEEILPEALGRELNSVALPTTRELCELYAAYIERWHNREGGRLKVAASCSAPQRVELDYLQELAALSRRYDLPHNIHLLETRLQRVLGERKYGTSLIRYCHDHDILDERSLVIHAIWVDEGDLDLLAERGCSVAHNPVCNLRLGSGIMPFRDIAKRGINICLGSDELCSDDSANMWQVGKLAAIIHNITDPDFRQWPTPAEILRCLTVNGCRAMRTDSAVGTVEEGKKADLVLLDLQSLPFTPLNDLRRQLVLCESGASVQAVIVDGQPVVEDGVLLTTDEKALKEEIKDLMQEYRGQYRQVEEWVRQLEPWYEKMYRMAVAAPVPMNRWVAPS